MSRFQSVCLSAIINPGTPDLKVLGMHVLKNIGKLFVHHSAHESLFHFSDIKERLIPCSGYSFLCSLEYKPHQLLLGFDED